MYIEKDTCKLRANSVRCERRLLVTFTFLKYDIYNVVANVSFSLNLQNSEQFSVLNLVGAILLHKQSLSFPNSIHKILSFPYTCCGSSENGKSVET